MATIDLDDGMRQGDDREKRGRRGWLVSGALHLGLVATLACLVGVAQPLPQDLPPYAPNYIPPPKPEKPVAVPERAPVESTEKPVIDEIVETPVATETNEELNSPIEPVELTTDQVATPTVTDVPTPSPSATGNAFAMAFLGISDGGTMPGGIGPRGKAHGPGKGKPPGRQTVMATKAALRWFARHQSPAGGWSVSGYQNNCADAGPRCEPGTAHTGPEGDVACTSLALLCFLGYGHDGVNTSEHKKTVARGLQWLLAQQRPDGSFGERNYEHSIAVMAIADAIAASGFRLPPAFKPAAQKGVDVLLARQNPAADGKTGSGWDYGRANPRRDDSSVTGWNIMALKSAYMAELSIGNGLTGGTAWLERAWQGANPDARKLTAYDQSVFPYTADPTTGATERDHLAGLGATCAAFLGAKRGNVLLESLVNRIVAKDLPTMTRWPCNVYLLYYDTMAMFQATSDAEMTDPRWVAWYQPVMDMLVGSQRRDTGCFDGSWDFQGTQFHGHETGRLLSTALCCLSLQTQERFQVATVKH